jgi:hypothetical protein
MALQDNSSCSWRLVANPEVIRLIGTSDPLHYTLVLICAATPLRASEIISGAKESA